MMSTWPRRLAGDKSKAAMPHHYSAAKYQQSVRLKHRAYEVASKLFEYESWEIIPNDVLQEIDQQAQLRVNKLVQQDQIVWALPPDAVQLQAQFRLSEESQEEALRSEDAGGGGTYAGRVAGLCPDTDIEAWNYAVHRLQHGQVLQH